MGRLGRFLRLSSNQRRLRIESALLDGGFRLLLLTAPFSWARSAAVTMGARPGRRVERRAIVEAVGAAGRVVPGSNCLSEALTGWVLLARGGFEPGLKIGVSTSPHFQAHAWVVCDGEVLVGGGGGVDAYHPLTGDLLTPL